MEEYFILKTYKDGIVKHKLSHQPGTSQTIPNNYLNKKIILNFIQVFKLGDCIFHHCEVIHGSNANKSNLDRVIGHEL